MSVKFPFNITIIVFSIILFGSGCHKTEITTVSNNCDTTNTMFSQLYNNLLTYPNLIDDTIMDVGLHAYTFEVTNQKTICNIGYQDLGVNSSLPDLIEIYDNTTNTLLYTGSNYFSTTAVSYVSITPVSLTVGNSYTVSRTRNYITFFNELLGRVIRTNDQNFISYPIIFGDIKIISSSFGSTANNSPGYVGIPFIELVFQ